MSEFTNMKFTPHSDAPSAVEATLRTLEALPLAGFIRVDEKPRKDGSMHGLANNPDFAIWAAVRQGYVASAEKLP